MDPRTNRMLFKAACIDFILLGLLTMFLFLYKMPLTIIIVSFITCCAGLLFEVIHGLYLIWCSLTKKTNHQINERTRLLTKCSDLEAQYMDGTSQNLGRSSPVPIPRQRPDHAELIPWLSSRPCLASLPWMGSSVASWYLAWRRKYVTPGRRYTVSENGIINQLIKMPKISRNHTLSESAIQDFEVA